MTTPEAMKINSCNLILRLAVTLLLGLFVQAASAETLVGRVVLIADGDTITVLDAASNQHKIRLMGIDAPEKTQAFGNRSQSNLGALLSGQEVAVEWNGRDRNGLIVGKVLVAPVASACRLQPNCPKTVDAGLQQVRDGLAWWHPQTVNEQTPNDRAAYQHAEFDAKIYRRGLWSDTNPTPPWQWPH